MSANGSVSNSTTFGDVYFGDVIICSGQSNMEYPVSGTDNGTAEIDGAKYYPNIRLFNVVHNESNSSITTMDGAWQVASNDSVKGFSAVCYIAGRMLADWLRDTKPDRTSYLGLIESNIGGTTVHFWAPPEVGQACNSTGILPSKGEAAQHVEGWLWNAMVNPIAHNGTGYPVLAAMYYQGEADSGENDVMTTAAYTCEMANMIRFWRKYWNQPKMPFVFVQLPGGGYGGCDPTDDDDGLKGWVGIRAAQQRTSEIVENSGMVVSVDMGGGLHYPHKSEVAHRAMMWLRSLAYGDKTAEPQGPKLLFASKTSQAATDVQLHFSSSSGIRFNNTWICETVKPCTWPVMNVTCCDGGAPSIVGLRLNGIFYHSGRPGHHEPRQLATWSWVPANLTIDSDNLIVTATPLIPPVGHYGWPEYYSTYLGTEAYSIEAVVLNSFGRPGCAIVDKNGIPAGTYEAMPVVVIPPS